MNATNQMWSLDEAVKTVRWLEPKLAEIGFHVALTGGVLFKGQSFKDLDLMVYPNNYSFANWTPSMFDEVWFKLQDWLKAERSDSCAGTSQIRDDKDVRWLSARGKRIDFFFVT